MSGPAPTHPDARSAHGRLAVDESSVWVVEDSGLEAEMAKRVLSDRYAVEVFPDGPSMLERLASQGAPDLLVLDWQLPGMSGIEVCRFLRSSLDEMALPILMLTVQGHKADIVEGLSAGANDYLTKPYDGAELLARATTLGRTRRLYDELRVERRRLDHLFCSLPACIATSFGPDHVIGFVNPELRSTWAGADPVVRRIRDALPALEAEHVRLWDEAYATGTTLHLPALKLPALSKRGDEDARYYSVSLVPQRDVAGQVSGVLAFAVDVTAEVQSRRKEELAVADRERLLEETRSAWNRAEQANRAKDEFLATVSHELRTPLNAITGWIHLLQRGAVPDEKRQHALDTIERNARAQTQLIDDLLDVSRIISGKLAVESAPVDLVSIVQMAIEAVRPSAQSKEIEIAQLLPEQATLAGDRGRLQQVVSNLLVNAVKFTPRGGRVEVALTPTPFGVELSVSDDGQGIEPAFLPHIFDRFRQADATITRTHGGLGLGLAIVRHLVEAHGGHVSAESQGKGRGATFRVALPSAATRLGSAGPPLREASQPRGAALDPRLKLKGRCVLIVEDDADSRELLVRMLQNWAVRVIEVANVEEAVRELHAERPDILVSDIGLPDEDGLSLIRRIRSGSEQGARTIPAVALTAYARAEDRHQAVRAGFDLHLTKPVQEAELAAALASLL